MRARPRRLQGGGGRIFKGAVQVEDEGRVPYGQDPLAGVPDPRRPGGQHRNFLGLEHAVPAPNCSRRAAERALADGLIAKLGIKTTEMEQPIRELSGSNQQKF